MAESQGVVQPAHGPASSVAPASAPVPVPATGPLPVAAPALPERFGARWIGLLAATVIALYLCWRMIQPFVEVLLWATVLVIVFYPVHWRILRRTNRPGLAAALSTALVVLIILVPLTLVALAIAGEAVGALDDLQAGVRKVLTPGSRTHDTLARWIDIDELAAGEWKKTVAEWVQGKGASIAGQTLGVLGKVVGGIVKLFFVILTMYYFFRDGERIKAAAHDVLPLEWSQSHSIFERTKEVIGASIYGVLVIAAIQGTLGGIAFAILRLPSPLMWGAVMFLLSMIPMIGSAVVWAPAALFLAMTGHWGKAIFLAAWGALVIGMIDNLLRPRLVGERTRLHELIVLFSVIGGLQVFGILGLVVGPVLVAITLALFDVFRQAQRPPSVTLREPTVMEKQDEIRAVPPEEKGAAAKGQDAHSLSPVLGGEGRGEGLSFAPEKTTLHPNPLP